MIIDCNESAMAGLGAAHGLATADVQYATDWSAFAKVYSKREGFAPHPRDSRALELFFWFTSGAYHEHLGHLNCKSPNSVYPTEKR